MAELHAPAGATRKKRIKGRGPGSGNGKTSGKGHKGQNARSGGGVRPGFEGGQMPLYRRIARRGFSNYPFKKIALPVHTGELETAFADGEVVNMDSLVEKRLIRKNVKLVKILAKGELKKKLTIEGLPVSSGARTMIEAAGGAISSTE
ncbi:50S ribosomal protein L15 [Spirochaeta africana]|uniref:Large ribosomal subunit protein uL15 n=1 Tax=Spirochaeta africana (strain ATCC 700263 / DSM 8902 / Z-7692) TaxID=889378 RepID=H9UGN1_SPIAZ|nr:50S ribosomal protein L15 [Spirochaeta africana]AFG36674.1 ribosomal protein L15, bacterial/organelle [Spirochaeta africana DSM 8902]